MVVRWRLDDPTNDESFEFPINPSEGGTPGYSKKIAQQETLAQGGATLFMEGTDEVRTIEVKGVIFDEETLEEMKDWFNRRHAVQLTDDLDRVFRIYITGFTPTRKRAYNKPFKHDYTLSAIVLEES